MGLGDMVNKAKEMAESSGVADQAIDKAAELAKEKAPESVTAHVDTAAGMAKEALGGEAAAPEAPAAEAPPAPEAPAAPEPPVAEAPPAPEPPAAEAPPAEPDPAAAEEAMRAAVAEKMRADAAAAEGQGA